MLTLTSLGRNVASFAEKLVGFSEFICPDALTCVCESWSMSFSSTSKPAGVQSATSNRKPKSVGLTIRKCTGTYHWNSGSTQSFTALPDSGVLVPFICISLILVICLVSLPCSVRKCVPTDTQGFCSGCDSTQRERECFSQPFRQYLFKLDLPVLCLSLYHDYIQEDRICWRAQGFDLTKKFPTHISMHT